MKCFEVNRHVVYAMRSIGKGHSDAKKFCAYMNMPPPSKPKPFQKNTKTIIKHVKLIARKSMSDAAEEIRILKNVMMMRWLTVQCHVMVRGRDGASPP